MNCPQCGAPVDVGATTCRYCGEAVSAPPPVQPQAGVYQQPMQQPMYQQPPIYRGPVVYQQPIYVQPSANAAIDPRWPLKNKTTAALLGILVGGIGAHKFYLGQMGMGVLYLLFCWTGIPSIIGFIEGIMYLVNDDVSFQIKNHCRLQ